MFVDIEVRTDSLLRGMLVFKKAWLLRMTLLVLFLGQAVLAEDVSGGFVGGRSYSNPTVAIDGLAAFDSPDLLTKTPKLLDLPSPDVVFDPTVEDEDANDELSAAAPAARGLSDAWSANIEENMDTLLKLRAEVFQKAGARDIENSRKLGSMQAGIDATDEEIIKGNISLPATGNGRMKITIHRGRRIAVFFDKTQRRIFPIFEKGEVDTTSREFRKWMANYHTKADKYKGLDVTTIELNEGLDGIGVTENFEKAKGITDKKWWADQFMAKYEHPATRDVSLGITAGVLQAGATAGLMAIRHYHGAGHPPMSFEPIALSLGFGSTLGIYGRTYYHLVNDGLRKYRAVRQLPAAYLYSSLLMWVTGDGDKFWSIKVQAASLLGIWAAKKFVSVPWSKTTVLRTQLSENMGRTYFDWDKQQFERSFFYLIPFSFKNIDSFYSASEKLPFVDTWSKFIPHFDQIPLLHNLLHTSMPYAQLLGVALATSVHLWYLNRLAKRPITEGTWPVEKAEIVREELEHEQRTVRGVLGLIQSPKRLVHYTKQKLDDLTTAGGYPFESYSLRETVKEGAQVVNDKSIELFVNCKLALESLKSLIPIKTH